MIVRNIDVAGIGARILAARTTAGLRRADLARSIHVEWRTLYRLERGENAPSLGVLTAIADRCGVSIDWIVRGNRPSQEAA